MSSEDSFISEVSEEVRRDKLYGLMRRYGWIAILLVVLVVGGAAWNEWRKATARASAEAKGDALIAALQAETAEARADELEKLPAADEPGARAIRGLLSAAAEAEAGDPETAAAALEAVIGDSSIPQVYRDVALLKRVVTGASTLSAEERLERLQPLLAPGNPFRLLAIEQRAFAEIETGQTDAALTSLNGILADAEVTEDLRQRARQLIVALGGSLERG
ncbi:MAG: tetratricopeptide repeat protein [Silicimonas sp.]|nr:tetratricopeptide repeat protein [Silicimonas sp.]